MLEILTLVGAACILAIITFFIPKTDAQLIERLEREGYRHVVITKRLNIWQYEVNVNHNNLTSRFKFKVWYSVGMIELEALHQAS